MKIRATVSDKRWRALAVLLDARICLLVFSVFIFALGIKTAASGFPVFGVIDNALFRFGVRLQGQVTDTTDSFVRVDIPRLDMQRFLHDPAGAVDMMSFFMQLQASGMKGAALVLHDNLWSEYRLNELLEHTNPADALASSDAFRAVAARMAGYRSLLANERILRVKVVNDSIRSNELPVLNVSIGGFEGILVPQMQSGTLEKPLLWRSDNTVRYDARLALFAMQQNVRNPVWLPEQGIKIQNTLLAVSASASVLPFFSVDSGAVVPQNVRYPLSAVRDQSALRVFQNKIVVIAEEKDEAADDLLLSVASLERAGFAVPFHGFFWLHIAICFSLTVFLFLLPYLSLRVGVLLSAVFVVVFVFAQQITFSVHREWISITQWLVLLLGGHLLVFLWCVKRSFDSPHSVRSENDLLNTMASTVIKKAAVLGGFRQNKIVTKKTVQRIQPTIDGAAVSIDDLDDSTIVTATNVRSAVNGPVSHQSSGVRQYLGRYQIRRELGRGAMGVVYLGFDPKISRQVAIKTLHYDQFPATELPNIKDRFFREAAAVGKLRHPNIVTIHDVGEEKALAYIAMDYVDGVALSEHTQKGKLLDIELVYYIMAMAADAVYCANSQGIIHRDIKPSNILYDGKTNEVKVADFGIARVMDGSATRTRTGDLLGSPLYMSPEQIRGEVVEHYSDIFSLGVTFYQLLTGELPFKADNLANLTFQIVQCKYQPVDEVRPELPASAKRIINKALQKNPLNRYGSAAEMQRALQDAYARDFS